MKLILSRITGQGVFGTEIKIWNLRGSVIGVLGRGLN
jgi:hypothetical protein